MERKTIGGFIAALRKANGMTQKDLAEKLNVSDKTVSRWERNDGVPDLSLIPVIAEIFDVTCDELLRGERRPMEERVSIPIEEEPTPRGEKQRQRILAVSLSKYKSRSFIAIGIAAVGLIAAMVGNFGFNRAYLGFLIGAIFYLTAVVCQAIFINTAFLSVSDGSLACAEIDRFKRSIIQLAKWSFGFTFLLLLFSLPLMLFPNDAYVGLRADTWFALGGVYAVLGLLLYGVAIYFLNASLLKKGVYTLSEKESSVYHHNHQLQRRFALCLTAVLFFTALLHTVATAGGSTSFLAEGIEFTDYDSFIAFMEQDVPYDRYGTSAMEHAPSAIVPGSVTYYDQNGNEISEDEARRRELKDSNGNVVCTYIDRNESVYSIRYAAKNGTVLPITVITHDAFQAAQTRVQITHICFSAVYCAEVLTTLLLYLRKRAK